MEGKSNEWPTRYEVGMMFETKNGDKRYCIQATSKKGGFGIWWYNHGEKTGWHATDNRYYADDTLLTKWLNPEAFPDVPRIGQEKPSVPPPSLRIPKPQYDRDEVLRVATIIMQELSKRPDFDDMYGAGELATERAINLIDAVNKRMEGGDHAIR
jgi:hypothetical protein